ncbi:MAG TPA: NUDIX domain-containing protein [Candidatus Cybelea sp.]|nr:NUDIX domain-containing protein [Candidatus Cybelea sp.]
MIALATGLLLRKGRVLLVASSYPNHPQPLWNLPGGRQQPGELLLETLVREVFEETGLRVRVKELAYISESYDGAEHFINVTFRVVIAGSPFDRLRVTPKGCPSSFDTRATRAAQDDTTRATRAAQDDTGRDHVVEVAWVPLADVGARISVRVVREPLLAYLRGALALRYSGSHDAGVTIEWPADSK